MKLLLTSAGVKNQSIRDTIVELAGKPIEECDTLYIPTGGYPMGGPYGSGERPPAPGEHLWSKPVGNRSECWS